MSEERSGGFLAGFVVGAITGAVAAYLLTQEDARDAIVGKAREAGNIAADATGDIRANAADLYTRGKTIVESARSNVDAAVAEGQAQAQRTREDLSRPHQSSSPDL
jgi:gas vesicle protein